MRPVPRQAVSQVRSYAVELKSESKMSEAVVKRGRYTCMGLYRTHDWEEVDERQKCRRCSKLNPLGVPPYIRFWDHVEKQEGNGHWLWTGNIPSNGYGIFTMGKPPAHYTVMAHRYAWTLLRGPIPYSLDIDHICRVRNCVNPDHMQPVTHKVNMRLRPGAGMCKAGHDMSITARVWACGRRACGVCYDAKLAQDKLDRRARGLKKPGRPKKVVSSDQELSSERKVTE